METREKTKDHSRNGHTQTCEEEGERADTKRGAAERRETKMTCHRLLDQHVDDNFEDLDDELRPRWRFQDVDYDFEDLG
jgi:hypothetical protein